MLLGYKDSIITAVTGLTGMIASDTVTHVDFSAIETQSSGTVWVF